MLLVLLVLGGVCMYCMWYCIVNIEYSVSGATTVRNEEEKVRMKCSNECTFCDEVRSVNQVDYLLQQQKQWSL
jgi:hypothetical protein